MKVESALMLNRMSWAEARKIGGGERGLGLITPQERKQFNTQTSRSENNIKIKLGEFIYCGFI